MDAEGLSKRPKDRVVSASRAGLVFIRRNGDVFRADEGRQAAYSEGLDQVRTTGRTRADSLAVPVCAPAAPEGKTPPDRKEGSLSRTEAATLSLRKR